jgi:hypothetical protein
MATAKPNILINSISGRLGSIVFYVNHRGACSDFTQCVRSYVIPRNPDTEAQRKVRRSFGEAVRLWQSMSEDERYSYNRKARYLNMSGYNLYISKYIKKQTSRLISGSSACFAYSVYLQATSLPYRRAIHSVSKPLLKAYSINRAYKSPNPCPG